MRFVVRHEILDPIASGESWVERCETLEIAMRVAEMAWAEPSDSRRQEITDLETREVWVRVGAGTEWHHVVIGAGRARDQLV